ncbi:MAG: DEAD/DEAH box helicase, partial [Steroidobacteraceae bacterium]
LERTWRMHSDVCRFISEAVYDGKLQPVPELARQSLVLGRNANPALRTTGVGFVAVDHDGCGQKSEEEASVVAEIYASLLEQRWRAADGAVAPLTADDILVVAPYNLQVNLLRRRLPDGARVGTVDKFQGQEAPVVLVSMATSSGEYLPRDFEFLYSKNRLNVALSRARCLALLVASPRLMDVGCHTPEQIELVNTLCWVHEYGSAPKELDRRNTC